MRWKHDLIDFLSHLYYGGIVGSQMFTGKHTFQIKKDDLDVVLRMIQLCIKVSKAYKTILFYESHIGVIQSPKK